MPSYRCSPGSRNRPCAYKPAGGVHRHGHRSSEGWEDRRGLERIQFHGNVQAGRSADVKSSMKFSHSFRVQAADIDEQGHVNNVVYLRWIQDVAVAHWRKAAT